MNSTNILKFLNLTFIVLLIVFTVSIFQYSSNFLILGITAILAILWFKSMSVMKKEQKKSTEFIRVPKSYARGKLMPSNKVNNPSSFLSEDVNEGEDDSENINEKILEAGIQSGIVARSFASIEDAIKLGWNFKEQIGSIGNQKIYKLAVNNGRVWEFDGLSHDPSSPIIPENIRLFGKLQYQEVNK